MNEGAIGAVLDNAECRYVAVQSGLDVYIKVTDMSAAVGYGFGKHDWDITDEQEKKSLKVGIHRYRHQ